MNNAWDMVISMRLTGKIAKGIKKGKTHRGTKKKKKQHVT